MAEEWFDTYVFEKGQFAPFHETIKDKLQWSAYLEAQGFAEPEQVWGHYPDMYIKVYEARPNASTAFKFAAVLNLVCLPHHVFIRDLNDLVLLLNRLLPLFKQHSRPDEDAGEALLGSQGADEQADAEDRRIG